MINRTFHVASVLIGLEEMDYMVTIPSCVMGWMSWSFFFVMDVHKDEKIFLQEPSFYIPEAKIGAGRKPTKLKADFCSFRLDKFQEGILDEDWKLEYIRDTVKGKLLLWVHKREIWAWDGKRSKAKKRVLIITKTTDPKPKVKYSISNGDVEAYSHGEYAYFVSQRYWVCL